jgi:glyoxylase I family protein
MLKPKAFHHTAVRVTDVERARDFYVNVLGLKELPRPEVPNPGAWLAVGDTQVHLIHGQPRLDGGEPGMATPPHIAIVIDNFQGASAELEKRGIEHRVINGSVAGSVVFLRDPDGNAIELRESY